MLKRTPVISRLLPQSLTTIFHFKGGQNIPQQELEPLAPERKRTVKLRWRAPLTWWQAGASYRLLLSPPPSSASTANASNLEPFLISPLSDAGSQGQCPGVSLVSSRSLVTLYAPIRRGGERERGGGAQEGASLWNPAGGAVQSPREPSEGAMER